MLFSVLLRTRRALMLFDDVLLRTIKGPIAIDFLQ